MAVSGKERSKFWEDITNDNAQSFDSLLTILSDLPSRDSRITNLTIRGDRKLASFLCTVVSPFKRGKSTEFLSVEVTIIFSGTSGSVHFRQAQHHQLDQAPAIMQEVTDIVADLLSQATLYPVARFNYHLLNENSSAESWWDFYPSTHPKILACRRRH